MLLMLLETDKLPSDDKHSEDCPPVLHNGEIAGLEDNLSRYSTVCHLQFEDGILFYTSIPSTVTGRER